MSRQPSLERSESGKHAGVVCRTVPPAPGDHGEFVCPVRGVKPGIPATHRAIDLVPRDMGMLHWYWGINRDYEREFLARGMPLIYGNFTGSVFPEWSRRIRQPGVQGAILSNWGATDAITLQRNGILFEMVLAAMLFRDAGLDDASHTGPLRAQHTGPPRSRGSGAPANSWTATRSISGWWRSPIRPCRAGSRSSTMIVYTDASQPQNRESVVRILCGAAKPCTDTAGHVWAADRCFHGGRAVRHAFAAAAADDPALYRRGRCGHEFTYTIPVERGLYAVRLKLAEPTYEALFARPFNVEINGREVLRNYDICQDARGFRKANDRVFRYVVPNAAGHIVLHFSGGFDPGQVRRAFGGQKGLAVIVSPSSTPLVVEPRGPMKGIDEGSRWRGARKGRANLRMKERNWLVRLENMAAGFAERSLARLAYPLSFPLIDSPCR